MIEVFYLLVVMAMPDGSLSLTNVIETGVGASGYSECRRLQHQKGFTDRPQGEAIRIGFFCVSRKERTA